MGAANEILKEALALKPAERAELIDKLLSSLDSPDKEIQEMWAKEVESRIDAFDQGKIKAVSLKEVFERYRQCRPCESDYWKSLK